MCPALGFVDKTREMLNRKEYCSILRGGEMLDKLFSSIQMVEWLKEMKKKSDSANQFQRICKFAIIGRVGYFKASRTDIRIQ